MTGAAETRTAVPTSDAATTAVALVAAVLGIVLRLVEVAQNHAFGFDDSLLAINIATRSLSQLAQPLSFEQTAPILFLWIDRVLVDVMGVNGISLRLLPVVAGSAVLPLTWIVARRIVPTSAAALAVALLAISPLAVDYSTSTKPYIVDAAVALSLTALSLRTSARPDRPGNWLALALAGAISIVLSTPAVFTLAACAAALAIALAPSQRRAYGPQFVMLGLAWFAVAVANYLLIESAVVHEPYLRRFWSHAFFDPTAPNLVERVRVVASSYAQYLFFGTSARAPIVARAVVALIGAVGAAHVVRNTGSWAVVMLLGPLALAVLASAAQLYPPSDRTWLFAAPGTVVLVSTGLLTLTARSPRVARSPAFALAGIALLFLAARQSLMALHASLEPDNLAHAIKVWQDDAAPGEPIYVFGRDAVRWTYYTTDWRRPDTARVDALLALAHAIGPNSGNAPTRGHAVHDEGDALLYSGAGRRELIGTATGIEGGVLNDAQAEPDTGWADNEARRIATAAAAANGGAWAFFLYCGPQIDSEVIAATVRRGGEPSQALRFDKVRLYRIRFPLRPRVSSADGSMARWPLRTFTPRGRAEGIRFTAADSRG